jgi:hypothetical protein
MARTGTIKEIDKNMTENGNWTGTIQDRTGTRQQGCRNKTGTEKEQDKNRTGTG